MATQRLFIVEDSPVVRERLAELLAGVQDIEIVGEWDGADAVGTIRRLAPDAVILDLHLQLGNGFDILRDLKSEPGAPVVIVLTNYPYPQYEKKARDSGADHFFDKSTEFDSVVDVLQSLAGGRRPRAALEVNSGDQTADSGSGLVSVPGISEHALHGA
jgi:DNA-binding NarL/FixJ family response regulator